jgi:proteasome lid subunit RPN8/RPN11
MPAPFEVRNSPEIDTNLNAVSPDVRDRAININDKKSDFTGMILRGEKTIETRDTPRSLRPFIGKRVGLVSTGKKGSAQLVGSAVVGEPKFYRTEAEFRADSDQHRVEPGSEYDIGPNGKWGYPLSEVRSLDTQPAPPGGRVARILPEGTRLSPEVVKLNKKTALQINNYNHAQQLFDRGYTLYGANNDGFDDSPNLIRTSDEIDNYDPENMVAMVPKGGDPVRNSPQVSSEQLEMDFDKAVDQLGTEEALSLEKPSPAPRAPRQPKDAPTTFSITASRIKRLLKRGPVNPIGMSAATPQDRHAVAALFRNPAFEAMRWVFLKEGKVVAVANTTVRRPEMVYIMTKNIDEQQMAKLAAESGADSVFWTHNHPSGNSRPSDPDINATRRFWGPTLQSSPLSKLNFLGHIVTNHTDHHLIDVYGRISLINVGGFHDPMLKKPVWDAIVDSPPALARAGAALANGDNPARLILFLDPRMNVKAVGEISPNLDSLKFAQEVRKYAKATGATSAVAYGHLGSDAPMMKQLVQDGILVDAHIIGSGGVRTALMAPPPALLPSPPVASAEDQIVRNVGEKLRFSPRIEQSVDALDKLGDKTLSQVNAKTLKYPKNPAYPKSIALPARWGLVNEKIVGMPKTSKEVSDIVVRQVDRLERVIQDMPDFAKESARFYLDMGLSSLDLASSALPGSKGLEQHKMADLMLRFLALGSPRTGVAANATKSSYSVSAAASDFTPGLKIGFGAQQRGAREAMASWKKDQPFDLNMPGIDNKVRNFYLNGLSEIIDLASADGDTASYEHLMNNVAGSLGLLKPGETLSKNDYTEVKRLLDGMATVDMWDMAAKGFAWPGYLIDPAKRNDPEQPWQWSQDKFAQDTTMGDSRWPQILKELSKSEKQKINGPEGLRYQQARALRIEGNKDWSEKTWQARLDSGTPFGPETPITVFTEGSEAGLSPGGAGPQYDAQQSIDGLVSDEINSRGLAPLFGKEKLFARNAQEILWALERLDNPVKANNELVLFGQTFKAVKEALQALQLGEKMSPKNRGNAVLDAMDRAYESMASQDIPIEVVSAGSTPEAARIQNKIAELKNAGVTDADRVVTESVAAGMMSFFNETAEKHGVNVILDNVRTGLGGYSEKGSANKAPNMVLRLRGNVPEVRRVLEILSRSMDQDGGNIFRRPTIRELNDPKTKLNNVLTLDTQGLTPDQQWAFFSDLNKLKDAAGNSFLTGFTQTGEGMAIGDQFYTGDMVAAIDANKLKIAQVMRQHGVGGLRRERLIVDTFFRGTPAEKSYGKGGFVKDLTQQIQNQIESAAPAERRFPMAGDATTRIQRLTKEAVYARFDGKSKATRYFVDLASQVDVAILRDEITEEVGDAMKADINRIAKRKIAQAAEKTAKAKAESAKVKEETAKAKISKEPLQ